MKILTGKRALVTGGSRGIGAAIALALAENGADVAISYERAADRARDIVEQIEAKGRRAVAIPRCKGKTHFPQRAAAPRRAVRRNGRWARFDRAHQRNTLQGLAYAGKPG